MGPFTVIVGANASGKSNLRDAFRFLHGIGRGYTLADIIGGKYGAGGHVEWEQIRGTARELVRFGHSQFTLSLRLALNGSTVTYVIVVRMDRAESGSFKVIAEQLKLAGSPIYTSHPGKYDPVITIRITKTISCFAWQRPESRKNTATESRCGRTSRRWHRLENTNVL